MSLFVPQVVLKFVFQLFRGSV